MEHYQKWTYHIAKKNMPEGHIFGKLPIGLWKVFGVRKPNGELPPKEVYYVR